VTAADARKWMQAMCQTPFFTRALAALGKISPYREANDSCGWSDLLRQHYFDLCDIVHVRGEPASYRELQPSPFVFGGCHTPGFSEDRLARTADSLLRTIQHIAAIVTLANPILLVGLPMTEKFGINPPISGFFEEPQAERLWALLPEPFEPFLRELRGNDPDILGIEESIHGRPDLTQEEFRRQVQSHDAWLRQMGGKTDSQEPATGEDEPRPT